MGARPVDAILLRGAVLLRRSRDADDAISIKGTAVEPRNWDTFLCAPSSVGDGSASRFTPRGRGEAAAADPGRRAPARGGVEGEEQDRFEAAGGQPSGGGRQYEHGWTDLERGAPDKYEMATVQFGYQAPLPNIVRTLKSKDNEEGQRRSGGTCWSTTASSTTTRARWSTRSRSSA